MLEGTGIAGCLLMLVGMAVYQFVARNLRLHGQAWMPAPPLWIDGVIRHSVFVLGFLGAGYATFTGRHIRIDAVTRMLGPRARMAARIVSALVAAVVCAFLVRGGLEFLAVCREEAADAVNRSEVFTSARGALVIVGGVVVVGFHFVVQAAIDVVYVVTGREPPAAWIAEASHGEAAPPSQGEG